MLYTTTSLFRDLRRRQCIKREKERYSTCTANLINAKQNMTNPVVIKKARTAICIHL